MIYDACIIGGGINGVGIARDAAGRGLKVLLLEKGDLGGKTSSNSSKMIHGGLRYLEFYEFGLVRKSLMERETMMAIASQIVSPLRICIPHRNNIRPTWMVRIGLFIYDHLIRMNILPKSETIHLNAHPYGQALKDKSGIGFAYSDCWVDDARLVILNAMDAKLQGADIRVQTPVQNILPENGFWNIETPTENFQSKIVINAAGPYGRAFLDTHHLSTPETPRLRLVQGSHIIIPKLYDGKQAYLIQCPDKRVVFVWPFQNDFSLVGTTETVVNENSENLKITEEEIDYLCGIVNREFEKQITRQDIIHTYSGVRPLFDTGEEADARKVTRDYKLVLDNHHGSNILNVFGGKLTTYRPLSEEVVDMLKPIFPDMSKPWTALKPLPHIEFEFAPDEKTLRYFIEHEWARNFEDVLWRRTKWGLTLPKTEQEGLKNLFKGLINEKNSSH